MNAKDIENRIWEVERIAVVIRCLANEELGDYPYVNAAEASWTLGELINKRIIPSCGNCEVVVLDGFGQRPQRNKRLGSVRESYHSA